MTELVKRQLELLNAREYRKLRHPPELDPDTVVQQWDKHTLEGEAARFAYACTCEKEAVFHGEDLFGFNRYCSGALPNKGRFGNVVIDYETVLAKGLCGILDDINARRATADEEAQCYYDAVETCYKACFGLVEMYKKAATVQGNTRLAQALAQVPRHGARSYYEALVMLRFLSYVLRINRCVHLPLGRFDLYMRPYYERSVAEGMTESEGLELTELFFIAMNFDSDLYIGIQKGDNGQSLVLGGCDREGNEVFGPLSEICLQASEELVLIDPKVNLRVNKSTPLPLYERGTRLTKQGLGFPQYSNDDIAIPFLISLGYDPADARNYAMAACWEFISSGNGADTPNKTTMLFPLVVERVTREALPTAKTFEEFLEAVGVALDRECDRLMEECNKHPATTPVPLLSSFISPTIEQGRDITRGGGKYHNYGLHGAGISTAADALAAIREGVFERKDFTARELLAALDADFVGYEALHQRLLALPKFGNHNDEDRYTVEMAETMIGAVEQARHEENEVIAPSFYSLQRENEWAENTPATPDGKRAGVACSENQSPVYGADKKGITSLLFSLAKIPFEKTAAGGLNLTFSAPVRGDILQALVKTYFQQGGLHVGLSVLDHDTLKDAMVHPEKYRSLTVRLYGFSEYFISLPEWQQLAVLERTAYEV